MKTVEINLYTIDELKSINKKAYEKVLSDAKDDLIDFYFNDASYECVEKLKSDYNLEIDEKNIYYSISYCQGDGVCFTDSNILSYNRITKKENLNAFEKWILDNLSKKELALLLNYLNCNYNLSIKKTDHHYQNAYTCIIDYECFYSSDDPKYLDIMDEFLCNLCVKLHENVYIEICKDLENFLYSFYDIYDSDVIDFINNNGDLFTKEGLIYNE